MAAATLVTTLHGYYGADTAKKTLYYWTADSIEAVQGFYPQALPEIDLPTHPGEQVAFDRDRYLLPVRQCDYTMRNACALLQWVDVAAEGIPLTMSGPSYVNVTPLPEDLPTTGTLILLSCWVNDP